ncbi:MAG: carbohydrate-binding family 9-like protein [Mucinivorans sp.]
MKIPKSNWSQQEPIACNNWAQEFPYAPQVSFRAQHSRDELWIKFMVNEQYTMAMVKQDNGEVWTDSCVEFFISFDQTGYYNFEFSCIGKALLAFRKEKPNATHASQVVMDTILRASTLGSECFAEKVGPQEWELMVKIPVTAFFKHSIENLNGMTAKANFYKCGDKLTKPHFLSWQPIEAQSPNFHLPEFFGTLEFE